MSLKPEDPILNDHLGDAFWRVGRDREARFQWSQSLTLLDPKDEETPKMREKIKSKLAIGLPVLRRQAKIDERTERTKRTGVEVEGAARKGNSADVPPPDRPSQQR